MKPAPLDNDEGNLRSSAGILRSAPVSFRHRGPKAIDTLGAVLPDPEAARTHAFDWQPNCKAHIRTPGQRRKGD